MNVSATVVLQILTALGISGVIGAAVSGIINRKKLGADTTKIISEAAGGIVERLEIENTRMSARIAALETWKSLAEAREEQHRRVLQLHAVADHLLIEKLRQALPGTEFPEMPPLYPPTAPGGAP